MAVSSAVIPSCTVIVRSTRIVGTVVVVLVIFVIVIVSGCVIVIVSGCVIVLVSGCAALTSRHVADVAYVLSVADVALLLLRRQTHPDGKGDSALYSLYAALHSLALCV